MCEKKTQSFVKIIIHLVSFYSREADVPNMGRVFLLLHNLETVCLLCILHGFSRYGSGL